MQSISTCNNFLEQLEVLFLSLFGEPKAELGLHRVCLNTIVRKTEALDSERLKILPMGSRVNVVQRKDRRVRIDAPIAGWCSLISTIGDTILTKIDASEVP